MVDLIAENDQDMKDLLDFLHADESLHQNVISTLPACFKRSNNNVNHNNNNHNFSQNGIQKRIITVVSPDGQKYRDPNLRHPNGSPTGSSGLHDGSSKPLKRLNSNQIRLVSSGHKVVKVVKTNVSNPTIVQMPIQRTNDNQFVPYGKLYRTVLKNGKPIQTPVVTPQNDIAPKFKSQAWQKQRQLQVTQGSVALNGTEISRKQILKFAVLNPQKNQKIAPRPEVTPIQTGSSSADAFVSDDETEIIKAEPLDDDMTEVVELGDTEEPDDQPLNQILTGNRPEVDEIMQIDCSDTPETTTLPYGPGYGAKRERLPYSVLPRRHTCSICDKKFVRPAELERHFRIHTGEKPFKCNICDQEFTRKCHLTKHMITHDNKQYFCTICKFKTIRPDTFRRHLKEHKNKPDGQIDFFDGNLTNLDPRLAQNQNLEIVTEDQFDMMDGTSGAYDQTENNDIITLDNGE